MNRYRIKQLAGFIDAAEANGYVHTPEVNYPDEAWWIKYNDTGDSIHLGYEFNQHGVPLFQILPGRANEDGILAEALYESLSWVDAIDLGDILLGWFEDEWTA